MAAVTALLVLPGLFLVGAPAGPVDAPSAHPLHSQLNHAALTTSLHPVTSTQFADPRKPNIWLITVDDMRADELRYMPRVRAVIGARGFVWDNAFSTFPLCCPARASMVTGMYAHNHHVLGNDASEHGGFYYFMNHSHPANTLGTWMRRRGYMTAFVGKFLNRYGEKNARQVPPGWTQWRGLPGLQAYSYFDQTWNVNGRLVETRGHNTLNVTKLSRHLMNNSGGKPFFLWSSYLAPHAAWDPGVGWHLPRPMRIDATRHVGRSVLVKEHDLSDKPAFLQRRLRPLSARTWRRVEEHRVLRARALMGVDRAIDRTIGRLASQGLLSKTLIIFTSDNGYALGEHNIPGGKELPYEQVTKVPLMMRGPGVPIGMSRVLVGLHDITATILEASGAYAGRTQDGVSLLSIARDPGRYLHRPMLFEGGNVLGSELRLGRSPWGSRFFTAIRTQRYVYIRYINGAYEFYDLRTDPNQLNSIRGRTSIRYQLAAELRRLRNCDGSECNTSFRLRSLVKQERFGHHEFSDNPSMCAMVALGS